MHPDPADPKSTVNTVIVCFQFNSAETQRGNAERLARLLFPAVSSYRVPEFIAGQILFEIRSSELTYLRKALCGFGDLTPAESRPVIVAH